jgi:nitrile hydratase
MNGVHDMGGMHGLGEIGYEKEQPGYHEAWEVRLFAIVQALRTGSLRPYIERIPGADYLSMGYYERWLAALVTQMVEKGVVTRAELETGKPEPASSKASPLLTPEEARELLFRTPQSERDVERAARFRVGDRVRGRNIHPKTHTRMPRYTRGRTGVVERVRGVFDLPDSEAALGEPMPQHVYLVRFDARELWGEETSAVDSVYIDMWEDYLEPA